MPGHPLRDRASSRAAAQIERSRRWMSHATWNDAEPRGCCLDASSASAAYRAPAGAELRRGRRLSDERREPWARTSARVGRWSRLRPGPPVRRRPGAARNEFAAIAGLLHRAAAQPAVRRHAAMFWIPRRASPDVLRCSSNRTSTASAAAATPSGRFRRLGHAGRRLRCVPLAATPDSAAGRATAGPSVVLHLRAVVQEPGGQLALRLAVVPPSSRAEPVRLVKPAPASEAVQRLRQADHRLSPLPLEGGVRDLPHFNL